MSTLTKAAILAAQDLKTERVAVPEWGGDVIVRMMTGIERDAFEASLRSNGSAVNLENVRARLLVRVLVDEDGGRIFTDGDMAELGQKSGATLDRLFETASKLNALSQRDVERLAKN